MLQRMTPRDYAHFWENESTQFAEDGIYTQLSRLAPAEATLEVGCGAGWSTVSLAADRPVLAVDNNSLLVEAAKRRIAEAGLSVPIVQSDLFEPTVQLRAAIASFQPRVVAGWFIGSHPDDNDKHTPANLQPQEKPKVYRERVEDRLVAAPLCPASVEWVHTVQRIGAPPDAPVDQIREWVAKEYSDYMFNDSGFDVVDVEVLAWNKGATPFPYVQTTHANARLGTPVPVITSVLARRARSP